MKKEDTTSWTISSQETSLNKVEVFFDKAQISRTISLTEIDLPANLDGTLIVTDLPIHTDKSSVRLKGNRKYQILEVVTETYETKMVQDPSNFLAKLEELRVRRNEISTKLDVNRSISKFRAQYVESVCISKKDEGFSLAAYKDTADMFTDYSEQIIKLNADDYALVTSRNEIDKEIREMELESNKHVRKVKIIIKFTQVAAGVDTDTDAHNGDVPLFSSEDNYSFYLTYNVGSAKWSPSYDLKVDVNKGKLTIQYYAEVTQDSGEDWEDVELSLSTSKSSRMMGDSPPSVMPMALCSPYQFSSERGNMLGAMKKSNMKKLGGANKAKAVPTSRLATAMVAELNLDDSEHDHSDEDEDDDEAVVTAAVSNKGAGISSSFAIAKRTTINSDHKVHRVTIAVINVNAHVIHYASPKETNDVYLQCIATNKSDYMLLACEDKKAAIFVDSTFTMNGKMDQCAPGDSMSFFMGVDPQVIAGFKETHHKNTTTSTLLGGNLQVMKKEYKLVISNKRVYYIKVLVATAYVSTSKEGVTIDYLAPSTLTKLKAPHLQTAQAKSNLSAVVGKSDVNELPNDFVVKNEDQKQFIWFKTVANNQTETISFEMEIKMPKQADLQIGWSSNGTMIK